MAYFGTETISFKGLQRLWDICDRSVGPPTANIEGQLTDTAAEKSIIFVTNNASKSRQDYKSKFDKLGIQAEVVRVCSSSLTCQNKH